ncbi:MAG: hypothetical protein IIC91_02095 [Chloroflexi bacterium]|nr:hypothetical protein [Chloroflexota bacterium]
MTHASALVLRIAIAAAFLLAAAFVAQPSSALAATAAVDVGDIWFCDATFENGVCETTIDPGDTVVWDFSGANLPHTTTECGASCDDPTASPLWDSGLINDGTAFQYTFDVPGTYLYYCQVHPTLQRGRIVVRGNGAVGDANCNGAVDSIDAALILQLTAGLVDSLPCQGNADVNDSGAVDSIDAALVLQFTAGLLPNLPP